MVQSDPPEHNGLDRQISMPADDPYLMYDGAPHPVSRAVLRGDDRGLTIGWAVFETLRCIEGAPLASRRHLSRLGRSMAALNISHPDALDTVLESIRELLRLNGLDRQEARARITVTAGPAGGPPCVLVHASPLPAGIQARRKGTRLVSTSVHRGALAAYKTTGWLPSVVARFGLGDDQEALLMEGDHVLEGATSNILAFRDGVLRAPIAGALPGIARAAALEAAVGLGWVIDESPLKRSDLYEAEVVWLTSSLLPVAPATHLDGDRLAQVPSLSQRLRTHTEDRLRCY